MPFKEPDLDCLREDIVNIANGNGVEITRADDFFDPGVVIDQILDSIDKAHIIIAVCTKKNPNIFLN